MPFFTTQNEGATVWIPRDRLVMAEPGPGGLTTMLHVLLMSPQGPTLAKIEMQGSVKSHAEELEK